MEVDKETLEKMSPEQKAEYEKLMAEIKKVEDKISAPPKSEIEQLLEAKRRELEEKKEKERIKAQEEKDNEAYQKAKEKYGFRNLAIQENTNGAIIVRKPSNPEFKQYRTRLLSTEDQAEREKYTLSLINEILVYPSKQEMAKMFEEHPLRLGFLADSVTDLALEGGKLRQKKV